GKGGGLRMRSIAGSGAGVENPANGAESFPAPEDTGARRHTRVDRGRRPDPTSHEKWDTKANTKGRSLVVCLTGVSGIRSTGAFATLMMRWLPQPHAPAAGFRISLF